MPDPDKTSRDKLKEEPIAVALAYAPEKNSTPKVIAGGRGAVAEQILAIAFANGIKVREDADLAQLLSSIDIDSEIPLEAFAAVAEILVYVYRANNGLPDGPEMAVEKEVETAVETEVETEVETAPSDAPAAGPTP